MTTSSMDDKSAAASRVEEMAFELSGIVATLRSGDDDCEDLMDHARAARDHLDNLAIGIRKRLRRAQFISSMTA
ncbi:MAG TPA: hypothetical protein VMG40_10225 [Bryobacteraceae bacterium]|nr:hypothetical protein [Bryobacteraceae bacterium]